MVRAAMTVMIVALREPDLTLQSQYISHWLISFCSNRRRGGPPPRGYRLTIANLAEGTSWQVSAEFVSSQLHHLLTRIVCL